MSVCVQEHQVLHRCLQHCLNNLLQERRFTAGKLQDLAQGVADAQSTSVFRHGVPLLGLYDVHVLEVALLEAGLVLTWHDARDQNLVKIDFGDPNLVGIIVNAVPGGLLQSWLGIRHWWAVRKVDGSWWDLDSKLRHPRDLGPSHQGLKEYLADLLVNRGAQLFVIQRELSASL